MIDERLRTLHRTASPTEKLAVSCDRIDSAAVADACVKTGLTAEWAQVQAGQ